ncbi:hypothetical protein PRZ61_10950 [Halomonas pacifica]|uniref:hypothetical protein n=1 Tax=Bisbaumannia pacifica TaxID=77098 RepID=UPI002358B190|nr:hypothetical protein [Halomonas pacifica]MDC8803954.1 hypothetical protein [Halomonas pacifica]
MITAYEFDARGVSTGATRQVGDGDGLPLGWTRAAPPALESGQSAVFDGRSGWRVVTSEPPWPPEPVPGSVTRRQGKQQLVVAGLLGQVQAAIDAIGDDTERQLVQVYYDDAETWERDHPQLLSLASALGLADGQVDDLFRQAADRQ